MSIHSAFSESSSVLIFYKSGQNLDSKTKALHSGMTADLTILIDANDECSNL